jgi:hypothetical protein
MAVGFKVKYYWYQIGTSDFLHAFFSTICFNLENKNWGSKYPYIMKKLYSGELNYEDISSTISELNEIKYKLQNYSPEKVVWDIDNLSARPPWGNNISTEITDLSNYFVTSDGEDFISMLQNALEKAKSLKTPIRIENI